MTVNVMQGLVGTIRQLLLLRELSTLKCYPRNGNELCYILLMY